MTGLTPEQINAIMGTDVGRQQMLNTRVKTLNEILNATPEIDAELKKAQTAAQLAAAGRDERYQPTPLVPAGWDEQVIVDPNDPTKGAVYRVNKQDPKQKVYMGQATPKQMRENVSTTETQDRTSELQWSNHMDSILDNIYDPKKPIEQSAASAKDWNDENLRGSKEGWQAKNRLYYLPTEEDDRGWIKKTINYFGPDDLFPPPSMEAIPYDLGKFSVGGVPLTIDTFRDVQRSSGMTTQQLLKYLIDSAGVD